MNGGYSGAMEASAKGAFDKGGQTIGITTVDIARTVNSYIKEHLHVKSWRDRLFKLIDLSEGYVILDGSMGTLVEYMTVWEMAQRGFMEKPIVVLGKRLQSLTKFIEKFPKVSVPKDMSFALRPEDAVGYLKMKLSLKSVGATRRAAHTHQ